MAEPTSQKRPDRGLDLILLSIAAGSADAAGYLGLGKVFTANMSGNVVLLGIALSEGRGADTGRTLFSLFSFITGAFIGGVLCHLSTRGSNRTGVSRTLAIEAGLLLVYAILYALHPHRNPPGLVYPLIALLGLAMGLQSAAAVRLGIPGVVTTVVTGTLTSLITGLTKTLSGSDDPAKPAPPTRYGLQALVIVTYCGGAAMSGLLMSRASAFAGFFPVTVLLLIIAIRLTRR